MQVHIIGLPRAVQLRLEAKFLDRHRLSTARMEIHNKRNEPSLVPFPAEAVLSLQEAFSRIEDPADLLVVVLPYAPVPDQLADELAALSDLGVAVHQPTPGQGRWPVYSRRKRMDQEFLDGLYFSIVELTAVDSVECPSERFITANLRSSRFVVAEGAITSVNEIAHHRYSFIERAVSALAEIAEGRQIGSFDTFFTTKGLNFASSGGITVTPEIWRNGERIASQPTNHHLKQGDATTRVAAVRLYFDVIQDGDERFVVVLYAGPHPDKDLTRRVELPGSER